MRTVHDYQGREITFLDDFRQDSGIARKFLEFVDIQLALGGHLKRRPMTSVVATDRSGLQKVRYANLQTGIFEASATYLLNGPYRYIDFRTYEAVADANGTQSLQTKAFDTYFTDGTALLVREADLRSGLEDDGEVQVAPPESGQSLAGLLGRTAFSRGMVEEFNTRYPGVVGDEEFGALKRYLFWDLDD